MPRNTSMALLSVALPACASFAPSGQEADLVLVCPITITQGTSEVTVKRRFEINYDTHKVAEYINQGNGWTPAATLELRVADHDRMVFAGGGIHGSNIDQHTGEYRQVDGRGKAHGTCERTAGKRMNKFWLRRWIATPDCIVDGLDSGPLSRAAASNPAPAIPPMSRCGSGRRCAAAPAERLSRVVIQPSDTAQPRW